MEQSTKFAAILRSGDSELVNEWVAAQLASQRRRKLKESDLRDDSSQFLALLRNALERDANGNIESPYWDEVRHFLEDLSRSRAETAHTPSETATFIFSLKQPLLRRLQKEISDPTALADEFWKANELIDRLGLYTTEMYQKTRESVINQQQQEMIELSTPVVELWRSILAVPLIGTLDSNRTQVIMESLLQEIVRTGARLAIIDITGVPTVDTLVAQHLLKTVAAARLMGADCMISGIRPQIAQTIVHLGVSLTNVLTKATLADAFALALQRMGYEIVSMEKPRAAR
jgi:rsbT co-antagonist protein RsbR